MLKITKGLKKKKKGKKSKHKEEELFEASELEAYRREHQAKLETVEAGGESLVEEEPNHCGDQSDEWQRFKALTQGVDSVLKRTQGDLDRIKSTSYFQRKPPGPSSYKSDQEKSASEGKPDEEKKSKRWIGFEEGSVPQAPEDEDHEGDERLSTDDTNKVDDRLEPTRKEEEEDDEEESDPYEDIFDTSYVDVVARGEVKLAYIPDSPEEEEEGPDPFDTSIVDKVIKTEPADKKKKNLVSLGSAVEVLTGKVKNPLSNNLPDKADRPRRRPRPKDLLLGSFDEGSSSIQTEISGEHPVKSILDEETTFAEEIDLTVNLALGQPQARVTPVHESVLVSDQLTATKNDALKTLLDEFYVGSNEDIQVQNKPQDNALPQDDDLDDEFVALAVESISKNTSSNKQEKSCIAEKEADEFSGSFEDPFDTTFTSEILPGKFELKLIEKEILEDSTIPIIARHPILDQCFVASYPPQVDGCIENNYNFLETEQRPLSLKDRDLLGGSTTDLSKISHSPIEPESATDEVVKDSFIHEDPFDTSVVNIITAPGKTEIKFLEKEFLAECTVKETKNDVDFDPRALATPELKPTKPQIRPDQLLVGGKRASISKVVAFDLKSTSEDLLGVDHEEGVRVSKPLTPYYAGSKTLQEKKSSVTESYSDPFDTSNVCDKPGKLELKLIENELVGESSALKHSLSDDDFDPRGECDASTVAHNHLNTSDLVNNNRLVPAAFPPITEITALKPDILSEDFDIKLHTPVIPQKFENNIDKYEEIDPFDTSIAQDLLPGKHELKILVSELENAELPQPIKRTYTDPDFNPRDINQENIEILQRPDFTEHTSEDTLTEKPLTPVSASSNQKTFVIGDDNDLDPFDTSCVETLVPSKIELKIIETELIHN